MQFQRWRGWVRYFRHPWKVACEGASEAEVIMKLARVHPDKDVFNRPVSKVALPFEEYPDAASRRP